MFDFVILPAATPIGYQAAWVAPKKLPKFGACIQPPACSKYDVGMILGEIESELLMAEAGGEDELRALLDHAFHDALGFGRLRHVLRLEHA